MDITLSIDISHPAPSAAWGAPAKHFLPLDVAEMKYNPDSTISVYISSHPRTSETSSSEIRSYSKEYETLVKEAEWVTTFFLSAATIDSPKSILPIYQGINRFLRAEQFDLCNTFLSHIKQSSSDLALVGILRVTFMYRNELSAWEQLLSRTYTTLAQRGHEPEKILRGLI